MASKLPLLSRLFDKGKKEETVQAVDEERIPYASPPEPERKKPELAFSKTDSFSQLWCAQGHALPGSTPPPLSVEGWEDMSDQDAMALLRQIQGAVNAAARKRLEQSRPKKAASADEEPEIPILDAQVFVFVPRDALTAWLMVFPPCGGGNDVTYGDLDQALDEARVTFGIARERLNSLPNSPGRYLRLVRAAKGTPPVNGENGKIIELFPRSIKREAAVDENNRVDYTSLKFFHNIEKGGVICRIIEPTEGEPGCSVLNEELPAKDGRPASPPKGRNTVVNEEGNALIATMAGQVEFSGRGFQVRPILDIPGDVDFSTGNINFIGDIYIHGDIRAGFSVQAMGSINVDGVVEACTVEAGGDLIVARGVQGDNQAVIRSHRNIYAKYLENCRVCAKESLHTDCIINCDVYCDDLVEVRSGRMTLIGGTVRAGKTVTAGTIGSRTEAKTNIILGGLPCGDFDYSILQQDLMEARREIETVAIQPESPQKLTKMGKLKVKLMVTQKKLEDLDKEKQKLAEESAGEDEEQTSTRCQLLADNVYPGLSLTINEVICQIDRHLRPCAAKLVKGSIQLI